MLRAVNRLIEPTPGEVYLDGEPTVARELLESVGLDSSFAGRDPQILSVG
jgi:hypothetical protein